MAGAAAFGSPMSHQIDDVSRREKAERDFRQTGMLPSDHPAIDPTF
jgi:hypothetical protein